MKIKNMAVFISGGGTTLQAIIDAVKSGELGDTKIGLVVSNVADAGGVQRALDAKIMCAYVPRDKFESDEEFGEALLEVLACYDIDFICLAGFLKLVPKNVIDKFRGHIINSHPGDTKKYGGQGMYGKKVHKAVLEAGEKFTMSTIHFANEIYDDGAIIRQEPLKIPPGITVDELQELLLPIEHHNYIEALKLLQS